MFCLKCGKEIDNSVKFCPGCGCQVMEEKITILSSEQNIVKSKNVTKLLLILALIAIAAGGLILMVAGNASQGTKTIYVKTKVVYFDANDPDGVPADSEAYEYDEIGNLKRSTSYYASYSYSPSSGLSDLKNNVYLTVYSYNDKGYRDGVKTYLNDEMMSQGTVTCDKQGRIVKVEYQDGASFSTINYTYDKNGNTLEYWVTENDEITFRQVYTYNANGDPLTYELYWNGKTLSNSSDYEYDSNGKLIGITEIGYYSDGASEDYGVAIYDENGVLSQVVYYDDEGNPNRVLEYDVAGNVIELSYYYKGELSKRTTYTYETIEVPVK